MKTLTNSIFLPSINPKTPLTKLLPISSSPSIKRFSSTYRSLISKCNSQDTDYGGLKDVLSGMVDQRVEQLLRSDENRVLLEGLEKANLRVEMARKELAEIERQELEAAQMRDYIKELERRESEISECQREISEARAMVEEADRSLSSSTDGIFLGYASEGKENEEINKDKERLESIKAASISAVVGTLAGLPISVSQVSSTSELIMPLGITFVSCALFGVTYRYTIRRDLDDSHLKTGISAAFGVVKGLAAVGAGPTLELSSASFFSHAVDGAVFVSENLLVFLFAAVGLDYCFKMRFLSPFPMKKSISPTK